MSDLKDCGMLVAGVTLVAMVLAIKTVHAVRYGEHDATNYACASATASSLGINAGISTTENRGMCDMLRPCASRG
jgi:hypothetical protein